MKMTIRALVNMVGVMISSVDEVVYRIQGRDDKDRLIEARNRLAECSTILKNVMNDIKE